MWIFRPQNHVVQTCIGRSRYTFWLYRNFYSNLLVILYSFTLKSLVWSPFSFSFTWGLRACSSDLNSLVESAKWASAGSPMRLASKRARSLAKFTINLVPYRLWVMVMSYGFWWFIGLHQISARFFPTFSGWTLFSLAVTVFSRNLIPFRENDDGSGYWSLSSAVFSWSWIELFLGVIDQFISWI